MSFILFGRVRVLSLMELLYESVCMITSSILRERIDNEVKQRRLRRTKLREQRKKFEDIEKEEDGKMEGKKLVKHKLSWSNILWNPIRLYEAVKRYHNCSSFHIVIMIIQMVLLLHFSIKTLIMVMMGEVTLEQIEYMDNIYYPHLLRGFPKVRLLSYLFGGLCFNTLSMRLIALHKLIAGSIKNYYEYQEITASQMAYAYLSTFKLSISDTVQLLKMSWGHAHTIKIDLKARKDHCTCLDLEIIDLDGLTRMEQMYYFNLLDSGKCFESLNHWFDHDELDSKYTKWHRPRPFHRCDLRELKIISVSTICGLIVLAGSCCILLLSVTYLVSAQTLWNGNIDLARVEQLSLTQKLTILLEPKTLFRLIETIIFVALLLPMHLDIGMLYFTIIFLYSRVLKLRDILAYELDLIRGHSSWDNLAMGPKPSISSLGFTANRRGGSPFSLKRGLYNYNNSNERNFIQHPSSRLSSWFAHNETLHPSVKPRDINQSWLQSDRGNGGSNGRLKYYAKLVQLLMAELVDIKREWGNYLNLLILWDIIIMSYIISLLSYSKFLMERVLLTMAIIHCVVPISVSLASGAAIESSLRKVYRIITVILVNENEVLNRQTLLVLLKINDRLNEVEARSLVIGGNLALTSGSVAHILVWIATGILLLNRFVDQSNQTT